ncbi:3-hydroxybutyryl-CoA dehydrogenase [Amycolatopsis mediterranei S699]|uniref:3-hydroxybutyryl-CoA dehydrogenase n=2 Tax=Amycolatopsis mediterranei TaxID=33910 RepID=A0A0H3DE70_AMYMU|nr:3-hydroxyacyl-CoA dehydrogenase family protein [Amycolatopsis mediterranei]ADJ48996.1 3-hydroxybutyryl-CoA dehydrogenase [Amycolatopsis mediterranei U32]AEK45946.1 3-hydroxybutyryl-CoA dehydrogenase [Amycolatopsis mediterranei S699]AFO80704.1 3-hydroxybutyryl-CoA dehydrogenase [Amycolatopsis mediterranei S699]AGT87832.1 3-hydroxybutyryl-CoA dehydrogenase [Amycolatopsis mediterranei RB]KDU93886.1 3-hydroxybutyryl-CoA dehydrogenase [Amycolatopsis mediterranei]
MTTGPAPAAVGVIGGGRMGAGIAQVFATLGSRVHLVERDPDVAAAARQRVADGLTKSAGRGTLNSHPEEVLGRLTAVSDAGALPSDVDLVVEAIPERADLKIAVLTEAEKTVSASTVLATNTSSLSISELGSALKRPERFLGMHFFNPVPASQLVEVIKTSETANAVTHRVRGWVRALGKSDIVVRDSPGFATSRLGVLLGLEAIRMLEDGVADADAIDNAMELGYRHPMGPLRSTDLVGLDVRLAIAEHLHTTLGERFAPPRLLRDKVARGELGRKTGRGFHDWS